MIGNSITRILIDGIGLSGRDDHTPRETADPGAVTTYAASRRSEQMLPDEKAIILYLSVII